ncbi:MAG TPA: UDP-N-acetylmuramoyl-L-alanyl-D-glutamate--2,6-diaminopimelate ligase [Burkholderiaceae bacterium]|jgi:UDP-N-acetylmuramoyl-L-alanyl-D-glutamate--2,6-diaminopimelate ligase|nr:UDP-N-acetylmuramoyl-L-alanyl-D-glutamate--2,6-diaminopimelate ligase [Burkholderiaceae bacterium]
MPALAQLASNDDAVAWLQARGARGLACDSRRVRPGDAFLAWTGDAHDGRDYVAAALAAGALACLVEAEGAARHAFADERIAALRGLKAAAGPIASAFFGEPSRRLALLAVTGTNGKTSTAWWIAQALSALGRRCAVVGTLGAGEPPRDGAAAEATLAATGLTSPDPVTLQGALRAFADAGFAACAIEASSIGLEQQRLAGCAIRVALFTNFTRDHLDHHGTMEAYWRAKEVLFDWPGLAAAVVNLDDARGRDLAARAGARGLEVWTVSTRPGARLVASSAVYRDAGLCFTVSEEGGATLPVRTGLIGEFNVANLLGVIGGLRALGVPLADAAAACARLTPVPGRMQRVRREARAGSAALPEVVVDYAHTPDALEKALLTLRPFARERGGSLWCVFGCGGNRDASKRPLMGAIAERLADHVVLTSDNPRNEAPGFILSQILVGVIGHDDVDVIEERRAAIAYALQTAEARDVVLVAGKGHEDYQEVAGVRQPFSDVQIAAALLAVRGSGGAA